MIGTTAQIMTATETIYRQMLAVQADMMVLDPYENPFSHLPDDNTMIIRRRKH